MSGIQFNGIKYIYLMDNNNFKKKSLEDNVYFTLRDIFANADSYDTCDIANYFNDRLTGNICLRDRRDNFKYTNVLYDKEFLEKLLNWLKCINVYYFEFILQKEEEFCLKDYIKFENWWSQFEELKGLLKVHYEKLEKWEAEDVQRDTDRLAELSDDENN